MTVFPIYGLDVIFPFHTMYPEQKKFMGQLKLSFDDNAPCILEIPSGCGKNIAAFSLILSYLAVNPDMGPLIYCVSSLASIDRVLKDLKIVTDARKTISNLDFDANLKVISLLPKSVSCINQKVRSQSNIQVACACSIFDNGKNPCEFFANTPESFPSNLLSIEDSIDYFGKCNSCPYFSTRRLCNQANIIICSPEELLSPRSSAHLLSALPQNTIIVFEDANSLDFSCCNMMSYGFSRVCVEKATAARKQAQDAYTRQKSINEENIQQAYEKLKNGLHIEDVENLAPDFDIFKHPVFPADRSPHVIPGTLRNPDVMLSRISNLLSFFNQLFNNASESKTGNDTITTSHEILTDIYENIFIEPETLHFLTTAFTYFLISNQITDLSTYIPLYAILDFVAVCSTYKDEVIVSTYIGNPLKNEQKILQISFLDASLAFSQILKFKRIAVIGECISPLSTYIQLLNFEPTSVVEDTLLLNRNNILPIVISRGTEQAYLSSAIELSRNINAVNNYGRLLQDIVKFAPDGIVAFFPSYSFISEIVTRWSSTGGILETILQYKLLFIESPDPTEMVLTIDNYKRAIDNGRGGVLFASANSLSRDSIDLQGPYGRTIIMIGMPDPSKMTNMNKSKADFLESQYHISKDEYLRFDVIRLASRCLSKILSSKSDYSLVLFADKRYQDESFMVNIPNWLRQNISKNQVDRSVDDAIEQAKAFFLKMSQPFKHSQESVVLNGFDSFCEAFGYNFTEDDLRKFLNYIVTKKELRDLEITKADAESETTIKQWIDRNWNIFDQRLAKYYLEWMHVLSKST